MMLHTARCARLRRLALVAGALLALILQPPGGARAQAPKAAETVVVEAGTEEVRASDVAPPWAGSPAQPGAHTLIPREQFRRTQQTVADVLETVPGVTVIRGGDALAPVKVTLRGSRPDQVLVIVDGVPWDEQTEQPGQAQAQLRTGVDLARLDLDQVESIEVLRGAASALYGAGASAGAIVIRTRRARGRAAAVAQTVGSGGLAETRAEWSEPLGGSLLTLRAARRHSEGQYVYFAGAAAPAPAGGSPCVEDLGAGYRLRKCNQRDLGALGLTLQRGERERYSLDLDASERRGLGGVEDPRPYGLEQRTRAALGYSDGAALGPASELAWQLAGRHVAGRRTENETLADPALENRHTEDFGQAEAWAEGAIGPAQRLRVGAVASRLALQDRFRAAGRDQGALYGRWTRQAESGTLEAAARFDAYSDVPGEGTWRLAGSQAVGAGLGLKAGLGTGYRPPSLYQLYDPGAPPGLSAANPALVPERSHSADGGLYVEAKERFYGEAIYFEQEYRDNIVAVANPAAPSLFRFENVSRTRSTGWEGMAQLRPAPAWSLQVSGTLTDAVIVNDEAMDPRAAGNRVPGVAPLRASAEGRWRSESWSVYAKGRYADRRYVDTANTRYLRPYRAYDAGWGFPLGAGFEGSLDLRNLTGETYAELDNFPAPGREVLLTVRWNWRAAGSAPPP